MARGLSERSTHVTRRNIQIVDLVPVVSRLPAKQSKKYGTNTEENDQQPETPSPTQMDGNYSGEQRGKQDECHLGDNVDRHA